MQQSGAEGASNVAISVPALEVYPGSQHAECAQRKFKTRLQLYCVFQRKMRATLCSRSDE